MKKKLKATYKLAKANLDYNAMLECIKHAGLYHIKL